MAEQREDEMDLYRADQFEYSSDEEELPMEDEEEEFQMQEEEFQRTDHQNCVPCNSRGPPWADLFPISVPTALLNDRRFGEVMQAASRAMDNPQCCEEGDPADGYPSLRTFVAGQNDNSPLFTDRAQALRRPTCWFYSVYLISSVDQFLAADGAVRFCYRCGQYYGKYTQTALLCWVWFRDVTVSLRLVLLVSA